MLWIIHRAEILRWSREQSQCMASSLVSWLTSQRRAVHAMPLIASYRPGLPRPALVLALTHTYPRADTRLAMFPVMSALCTLCSWQRCRRAHRKHPFAGRNPQIWHKGVCILPYLAQRVHPRASTATLSAAGSKVRWRRCTFTSIRGGS